MKKPKIKTPEVKEDPALKAERQQAAREKREALSDKVSDQTQQLYRLFGSRAALAGAAAPGILSGL